MTLPGSHGVGSKRDRVVELLQTTGEPTADALVIPVVEVAGRQQTVVPPGAYVNLELGDRNLRATPSVRQDEVLRPSGRCLAEGTMKRHSVVLALLIAGCSPGATPSPTSAPLPPGQPSPSIDERLFGEIVEIDPAGPSITLALGQLFGAGGPDEANAAARADGVIGPSEDLPNPFYVRDLHKRRTLPLDSAAKVVVLGWDADGNILPTPIGLAEFVTGWRSGPASEKWQPAGYYWCSVADGGVVGIEAEYTP